MTSAGPPPSPGSDGAEQSLESRRLAVEQMLAHAVRSVERSRPMPFSTSVMINGEEVLALLRQALAALPEELRAARWILKEREDMKVRAQREGEEIVTAARARAEQMVQRSDVVKAAELQARRTLAKADERSLRMKLETEDWCDQRLAAFEATLHKTMNAVSTGRQKLQDTRLRQPVAPPSPPKPDDDVFDQDLG